MFFNGAANDPERIDFFRFLTAPNDQIREAGTKGGNKNLSGFRRPMRAGDFRIGDGNLPQFALVQYELLAYFHDERLRFIGKFQTEGRFEPKTKKKPSAEKI